MTALNWWRHSTNHTDIQYINRWKTDLVQCKKYWQGIQLLQGKFLKETECIKMLWEVIGALTSLKYLMFIDVICWLTSTKKKFSNFSRPWTPIWRPWSSLLSHLIRTLLLDVLSQTYMKPMSKMYKQCTTKRYRDSVCGWITFKKVNHPVKK